MGGRKIDYVLREMLKFEQKKQLIKPTVKAYG